MFIKSILAGLIPGQFWGNSDGGADGRAEVFDNYELPSGVGDGAADGDDSDTGGDDGADDGQQARGADDAGDQPPQRREQRGGGTQDGQRRGAQDAGDRGRERHGRKPQDFPEHRYDSLRAEVARLQGEFASERRRLLAENTRFRTALGLGQQQPQQRELTPRQKAAREQLFAIVPELALLSNEQLKKLVERAPDLDRLATEYPQGREDEMRRWGGHAERMVRQVLSHAATQWLGKDKTAKDLDEDDRIDLDRAFVHWVSRRAQQEENELPNGFRGETTLRYESGDPQLVTEFWSWYTRRHGTPAGSPGAQRSQVVAAAARAERGQRTPRGGNSSAPVGSARREVQPKSMDDALDEGWSFVTNARAAGQ